MSSLKEKSRLALAILSDTAQSSARRRRIVSFSPERKTRVEIGDNNIIREYCHHSSRHRRRQRDKNRRQEFSDGRRAHRPQLRDRKQCHHREQLFAGGFVSVDDGAFLGGGSTFHQFMRIGRLVMVQGSSAFGKDLPPFVVAAERNSCCRSQRDRPEARRLQRKGARGNQSRI